MSEPSLSVTCSSYFRGAQGCYVKGSRCDASAIDLGASGHTGGVGRRQQRDLGPGAFLVVLRERIRIGTLRRGLLVDRDPNTIGDHAKELAEQAGVEVGRAHGEVFADVRPANAMIVVTGFIDPR